MKVAVFIQARMESTRFPGKTLKQIDGTPILEYVVRQASKIKKVDDVVVLIPDKKVDDAIKEFCETKNIEFFRGSEKNVFERFLEASKKYNPDIIVRLTADNPFIDPKLVSEGLEYHINSNSDFTSTRKIKNKKVIRFLPAGLSFDIFNSKLLSDTNMEILDDYEKEHVIPSFYKNKKIKISFFKKEIDNNFDFSIDSKEDLDFAIKIIKNIDFNNFNYEMLINLIKKPKITVYIANYNYEKYLKMAIESVISQTFQDFELLIFDDGSTDNSKKILRKYEGHKKINIIYQENLGLTKTANNAINRSNGEYIIRLDADDYFDENILLVLSSILDNKKDIGLVYPDYYEIDSAGEILKIMRRKRIGKESKLLDLPAHGACTLIRKNCLDSLGGYNEYVKYQDGYDLWIKFIQKFKPYNVNLPLFYYRKHNTSSTTNSRNILTARKHIKERFIKKNDKKKKICLIIPLRRESEIYKDLPLKKMGDKLLMEYILDESIKINADKVVVVTEDKGIADIVKSKNIKVIIRPKKLSKFGVPIEPNVLFVLDKLREDEGFSPDIVGVLFYTSPLVSHENMKEAINTLIIYDSDSVIGVKDNDRLHYYHGEFGLSPLFKKRAIKTEREHLYEESGAFIFSKIDSITPKSLLGKKIGHVILSDNECIDIEDKFTYLLVESILENKKEIKKLSIHKVNRGY